MIEKYAHNGIYISVENNSALFSKMQAFASDTNVSSATSSRYAVSMRSASAKKKVQDLSQVKVRIVANSQKALVDLVKIVRQHHCEANYLYESLAHTFPTAKCPPLAVTSMSVDDYYTTTNIVAKDYQTMYTLDKVVDENIAMMADELNSEEAEKRIRV